MLDLNIYCIKVLIKDRKSKKIPEGRRRTSMFHGHTVYVCVCMFRSDPKPEVSGATRCWQAQGYYAKAHLWH